MKKILFITAVAVITATACIKQNATPVTPLNETVDTATSDLKYSGILMNGSEGTVMGKVNIYLTDGKYQLELKDFSVTNGPDLHVYLSKETQPVNFIDLGKLKSTNGSQVYAIPGVPDFIQYKYALIHCQQYDVLFGKTELQQ